MLEFHRPAPANRALLSFALLCTALSVGCGFEMVNNVVTADAQAVDTLACEQVGFLCGEGVDANGEAIYCGECWTADVGGDDFEVGAHCHEFLAVGRPPKRRGDLE